MKTTLSIAVAALTAALPAAADVKLPSRVRAVTVYSQEALVERRAETTLTAGEHRLLLDGFPAGIDDSRLRIMGAGGAKVKITGVRLEPVYLEKSRSDRVQVLEEKIKGLQSQRASLADRRAAVNEEVAFLTSLKNAAASAEGGKENAADPREVLVKRMTPQDYGAFLKFYRDGVVSRRAEVRQMEREDADLAAAIQAAQQELNDLRSGMDRSQKRLAVDLSCSAAGDFALSASYVISPASWQPAYDVRVIPDAKELVLTHHALVTQLTGEDWNDVELTLSTAKPSLGAAPPQAAPWYLDWVPPAPPAPKPTGGRGRAAKAAPAAMEAMSSLAYGADAAEEPVPQDLYQTATVESRGASVVFRVKSREDVPSRSETPSKVTAAVAKFPISLEYETVPRLAPRAYLKSKAVNNGDFPLLAGAMNVYFGDDYAGSGALPLVAPGEEFNFYAGADESIKVEVENVKADKGGKLLSKDREMTYHYRLKLQSFRKEPVQITVVDRVPVSRNEKVKVSAPEFDPKPGQESQAETGLYRWKLTLPPQEKKQVTVQYKVSYPPDGHVPGL